MLTPETYKRVGEIFNAALELAPEERAHFLARLAEPDSELVAEVRSLLTWHEQEDEQIVPSPIERRVGPYQLIAPIGEGGMSTVYLAVRDDDTYRKRVALKLIKQGTENAMLIQRFLAERQILASLEHPNIAQLLDGGTTRSGLPYLVMEYVEGMPLDRYCKDKQLSMSERLVLFRAICSAVQYAHQNLVIHRDIKPSNILVTGNATPKLLDFGIAKLLEPDAQIADQTATALRIMTLSYASPEQVRGEKLTTATDIYSLGVVLYELLCGQRPYGADRSQPVEIAKAICEQEPLKPSSIVGSTAPSTPLVTGTTNQILGRQLKGDIDTILLMALRKEPERRYTSVEQFSEDIRRYLEGRPVQACKDTLGYRTSKFVARNKFAVIGSLLIALSLVSGIIGTTIQAQIAQRRFNDVRKLANTFLFDVDDSISKLPGSIPTRQLVVKTALEYLDNLVKEANNDPSLQLELAKAYEKVGDIQGNPSVPNLGDRASALASYQKGSGIVSALLKNDSENQTTLALQAELFGKIGGVQVLGENLSEALENTQKKKQIYETLLKLDPINRKYPRRIAASIALLGFIRLLNGDLKGSVADYRSSLQIGEELAAAYPDQVRYQLDIAENLQNLGYALSVMEDAQGAAQSQRRSLDIVERLAVKYSQNAEVQRSIAIGYGELSSAQVDLHQPKEALKSAQRSLEHFRAIAQTDTNNNQAMQDLATTLSRLGNAQLANGDLAGALTTYRRSLERRQMLSAADPQNALSRSKLADSFFDVGRTLLRTKDFAEARVNDQKALVIREELVQKSPTNQSMRRELAKTYSGIGDLYSQQQGRCNQAQPWYEKSLRTWQTLLPPTAPEILALTKKSCSPPAVPPEK